MANCFILFHFYLYILLIPCKIKRLLELLVRLSWLDCCTSNHKAVADPGFPVGGVDLVGGRGLPRWLRFENFVCQNERIWTLRGRAPGTPPLDSPMQGCGQVDKARVTGISIPPGYSIPPCNFDTAVFKTYCTWKVAFVEGYFPIFYIFSDLCLQKSFDTFMTFYTIQSVCHHKLTG